MVKNHYKNYVETLKTSLDKVDLTVLDKVVDVLLDVYHNTNQIFVMGNGGSAATGSHFAADINKSVVCSSGLQRFKVFSLNDNLPIIMAYANDMSYEDIFIEQLKNYLNPGDVVIGISGSGNSENVLRAIDYANKNEAITIGITGFDGGKLAQISQLSLHAEIHDMQQAEDVHLILLHIIMQILIEKLGE